MVAIMQGLRQWWNRVRGVTEQPSAEQPPRAETPSVPASEEVRREAQKDDERGEPGPDRLDPSP
jgi:hypothetical protein